MEFFFNKKFLPIKVKLNILYDNELKHKIIIF